MISKIISAKKTYPTKKHKLLQLCADLICQNWLEPFLSGSEFRWYQFDEMLFVCIFFWNAKMQSINHVPSHISYSNRPIFYTDIFLTQMRQNFYTDISATSATFQTCFSLSMLLFMMILISMNFCFALGHVSDVWVVGFDI